MEKRTIGGFIAALRKANGMTQKDLAEKLNVSDKTVSRWERDDGAPDLSVIPVIAEIFGVSCDELLRGERKPPEERDFSISETESTAKGEKQRQRLLAVSLSKYKNRSFISMGIAAAGLIAAMVGNFGFLRAYIGFLIGAIFYLASIVCQTIFINNAFLSVADDSLVGWEVNGFKRSVIRLAESCFILIIVLFVISLPLIVYPYDAYVGLTGGSWLQYGLIYGLIAALLIAVLRYFVNRALLKRGVYHLTEKEERIYSYNHKLKGKLAGILAAMLIITIIGHITVTSVWDASRLAEKIVFNDYDSFVEYMEQDIPYSTYYSSFLSIGVENVVEPPSYTFDDSTGEFIEEEALTTELMDSEGNVVCEYIPRNNNVSLIQYQEKNGTLLPIEVVTRDAYIIAQNKAALLNIPFVLLYALELAAVVMIYFRKRAK